MWISKKKYKALTNTKKELEYISTLIHGLKHDIIELKMDSNKPPIKKTNFQKQK